MTARYDLIVTFIFAIKSRVNFGTATIDGNKPIFAYSNFVDQDAAVVDVLNRSIGKILSSTGLELTNHVCAESETDKAEVDCEVLCNANHLEQCTAGKT